MSLIYDGFLSENVVEYIQDAARKYCCAIEMSSLPSDWYEWSEKNLIDYYSCAEDCQGNYYSRKTKKYCLIRREDDQSLFLFLKTKKEKDLIIRDFPFLVVKEEPFKTLIER